MKSFNTYITESVKSTVKWKGGRVIVTAPKRARNETMVSMSVDAFERSYSKSSLYVGRNGRGGIGNRYERFGIFLNGGVDVIDKDVSLDVDPADSIEAPEVHVNKEGVASFTNGRHRWAWLRDHGAEFIPVMMDKEGLKNAREFGYV